jgi:hypothetical protein
LADELGVEFRTVQSKINVEVDAIEGSLGGVHALKVLLEVLAAEVRGKSNDFLDAFSVTLVTVTF